MLPNHHFGVLRVTPPVGLRVLPLVLLTSCLSGIPTLDTRLRQAWPTLGPGNLLDLLLQILLGALDIDHRGVQ